MVVQEILHAHIPFLTKESTLQDAIDKMNIYQFPALVIVDDLKKPIGVLTEGDVCRAVQSCEGVLKSANELAFKFATSNPTCISSRAEISDALDKMFSSGLTILPVIEENVLLGIVLRVDLMQALLMDIEPKDGN